MIGFNCFNTVKNSSLKNKGVFSSILDDFHENVPDKQQRLKLILNDMSIQNINLIFQELCDLEPSINTIIID